MIKSLLRGNLLVVQRLWIAKIELHKELHEKLSTELKYSKSIEIVKLSVGAYRRNLRGSRALRGNPSKTNETSGRPGLGGRRMIQTREIPLYKSR
jgi:hypothetical protein